MSEHEVHSLLHDLQRRVWLDGFAFGVLAGLGIALLVAAFFLRKRP